MIFKDLQRFAKDFAKTFEDIEGYI